MTAPLHPHTSSRRFAAVCRLPTAMTHFDEDTHRRSRLSIDKRETGRISDRISTLAFASPSNCTASDKASSFLAFGAADEARKNRRDLKGIASLVYIIPGNLGCVIRENRSPPRCNGRTGRLCSAKRRSDEALPRREAGVLTFLQNFAA